MPLKLAIIGGCARIGAENCVLLCDTSERVALMYDCGGCQPDDNREHRKKMDYSLVDPDELKAVFVTHGHLDHIGGLGELAEHLGPMPKTRRYSLLGTKFTQSCVSQQYINNILIEPLPVRIDDCFARQSINGVPWRRNKYRVSAVHLDHTIPQATGFATTYTATSGREYRILDLGDFRIGSQWELLEQSGSLKHPDVLLLDSSGALNPGSTPAENRSIEEIIRILLRHPTQNVILAGFSTNVMRWGSVLENLPEERRIEVTGFSMERKLQLAADMGLIKAVSRVPKSKKMPGLNFMTGAQAEEGSALFRYVYGSGDVEAFDPSVVIVLSARVIPGHEKRVRDMIRWARNQMNSQGRIYASMNSPDDIGAHELCEVSPSGHCCRNDLERVVRVLQPRLVVPVHGNKLMRMATAEIASSIPGVESALVEDGGCVELF